MNSGSFIRWASPGLAVLAAMIIGAVIVSRVYPCLTVEQWTLIVSGATLVAVVVQIFLGSFELAAVFADLALARREAKLHVTASPFAPLTGYASPMRAYTMNLRVHNRGARTNSDARLKLAFPKDWGIQSWPQNRIIVDPDTFADSLLPDGYSASSMLLRGPFFPDDTLDFNSVVLSSNNLKVNSTAPEPIFYRIVFEDGAFPRIGEPYAVLSATFIPGLLY